MSYRVGDLVKDRSSAFLGIVIKVRNSVVPYVVYYGDTTVDIACDHDLELINGINNN